MCRVKVGSGIKQSILTWEGFGHLYKHLAVNFEGIYIGDTVTSDTALKLDIPTKTVDLPIFPKPRITVIDFVDGYDIYKIESSTVHCQLRIPRKLNLKGHLDLRNDFRELMSRFMKFRDTIEYEALEMLQGWAAPEDIDTAPTFNAAATFNAATTSLRAKLKVHLHNLEQLSDFVYNVERRRLAKGDVKYESIMRSMEEV
ncbi:MAG: hypothetical protein Q9180_007854 [Flavoplaca navasiana]